MSITFAGNLATEPELTFTPSGQQVVRLAVIENRRRRNAGTGEWEDLEPNRYYVEAWASMAEHAVESLHTGDRVLVTGTIVTDRWNDKTTGEARTAQHVKASDIGFSLKYHIVKATKATRTGGDQVAEE